MGYRQRNDVEKSCEWAIEDVFIAARRVTDNSRIKGLMDVIRVSFSYGFAQGGCAILLSYT
jgi:hypothetical protein